jgi:hypothetical protein
VFGELPKLLGRDFAIGFFLPFAVLLAVTLGLLDAFDVTPALVGRLDENLLIGTTVAGAATWLGGVALLGINRSVYRFFEGYGKLNPLRLLAAVERRRFNSLKRRVALARAAGRASPPAANTKLAELGRLMMAQVREFPEVEHLLPTRFGNALRAFEVYPRIMYGIDSIPGWLRLLAVIPKEFLAMVDEAKAQADFWLNLWLGGLVVATEWGVLAALTQEWRPTWWVPVVALAVAWWASRRALAAVQDWGEMVKAAFDVFLPDLLKKLGAAAPDSREDEQKMWGAFSQAVVFRRPKLLPPRTQSSPP